MLFKSIELLDNVRKDVNEELEELEKNEYENRYRIRELYSKLSWLSEGIKALTMVEMQKEFYT